MPHCVAPLRLAAEIKSFLYEYSALQDDPKYKQAMRVRTPEARLRAFLAICGSMRSDDSGGQQPKYRMDNFRIMAEFEKPKVCQISCLSFNINCCCALSSPVSMNKDAVTILLPGCSMHDVMHCKTRVSRAWIIGEPRKQSNVAAPNGVGR